MRNRKVLCSKFIRWRGDAYNQHVWKCNQHKTIVKRGEESPARQGLRSRRQVVIEGGWQTEMYKSQDTCNNLNNHPGNISYCMTPIASTATTLLVLLLLWLWLLLLLTCTIMPRNTPTLYMCSGTDTKYSWSAAEIRNTAREAEARLNLFLTTGINTCLKIHR